MIDIVTGGDTGFVDMAKRLGFDTLCMKSEKVPKHVYKWGVKKSDITIIKNTDKTRYIIEKQKPDIIYELENSPGADYIHQRNSGFNHVLARIAKEKGVAIGFSLALILDRKRNIRVLGRIRQNIALCRKYKLPMVIASFANVPFGMRAPKDIISLFSTLGMHPAEAKKALSLAEKIIAKNKKKKSPQYLADGAEIVE